MGFRSSLATSAKAVNVGAGPFDSFAKLSSSGQATILARAGASSDLNRRRNYRQKIRTLAYISMESSNRGVLRDLSESGAAIQMLAPLRLNQEIHFRLDLSNPRVHVEGEGRVAWTDPLGQAGMEFIEVPHRSRGQLKE